MPGNNAVGIYAANGRRSVPQHRRACGEVAIGRAQIDRHGQFHSRHLQHAYDLILDAVGSQVGGRYFAGFKVGEITLLFGVDALVVGLQVCQQFEVLLLRFVTVS